MYGCMELLVDSRPVLHGDGLLNSLGLKAF